MSPEACLPRAAAPDATTIRGPTMSQEGSTFTKLASHWGHPGAAAAELVTETREALGTVQPADLLHLAGLVETLVARSHVPESREPARLALFALFDTVRRRFFTDALRPDQVGDWTRLLLPAIERTDY